MNICFVYQDEYPWDVRVEKFCKKLSNNNYKIHLVSRNRRNLIRSELVSNTFEIVRLKYHKNNFLNEICNVPAFFSITWFLNIYKTVKNNNCNLIIVRDLPLALTCIFVSKFLNVKVYMDMAEDYPEMISDTWKYGKVSKIDYIIRNPKLLKILEAITIKYLDLIYVVSDESKSRLINLGVSSSKICVIGNTPMIENEKFDSIDINIRSKSNFNIVYVGGLEETRGLETVIEALSYFKEFMSDFAFIVVGTGTSLSRLEELTCKYELTKYINFLGWRSPELIAPILNASDVCIVPHYVTNHTDTTLPNKIYDYMLCGKPVLTTNSKSLKNLVEKEKCGYVYNDKDATDLKNKLILLFDEQKRIVMGNNGKSAVLNKYNWTIDSQYLLNTINC